MDMNAFAVATPGGGSLARHLKAVVLEVNVVSKSAILGFRDVTDWAHSIVLHPKCTLQRTVSIGWLDTDSVILVKAV